MSKLMSGGIRRMVRKAVVWYSIRNRARKARIIRDFMREHGLRDVILVGAVGDEGIENQDVVERGIEAEGRIVAAFNVYSVVTRWPFLMADARSMPFPDRSCDLVLSNAVIEHVGGEVDQRAMVAEHCRVGRAWVITTPNRWFPVESHTSVLFKHWSPVWREQRREFTRLLSRREFTSMLPPGTRVLGHRWSPTFTALHVD